MNWTDLNKSTQLDDVFTGHVRQRHDYACYWLAAAKLGRLVLGEFSTQAFQGARSHWSLPNRSSVRVLWTSLESTAKHSSTGTPAVIQRPLSSHRVVAACYFVNVSQNETDPTRPVAIRTNSSPSAAPPLRSLISLSATDATADRQYREVLNKPLLASCCSAAASNYAGNGRDVNINIKGLAQGYRKKVGQTGSDWTSELRFTWF